LSTTKVGSVTHNARVGLGLEFGEKSWSTTLVLELVEALVLGSLSVEQIFEFT